MVVKCLKRKGIYVRTAAGYAYGEIPVTLPRGYALEIHAIEINPEGIEDINTEFRVQCLMTTDPDVTEVGLEQSKSPKAIAMADIHILADATANVSGVSQYGLGYRRFDPPILTVTERIRCCVWTGTGGTGTDPDAEIFFRIYYDIVKVPKEQYMELLEKV